MRKENGRVTMHDLIDEVYDKNVYKKEIVQKIIMDFLDELNDSIINNEQVSLRSYFSVRHKIQNPRKARNMCTNEIIELPERMKFRTDFAHSTIQKLNDVYTREKRKKKTLNNNRIEGLN